MRNLGNVANSFEKKAKSRRGRIPSELGGRSL